MKNFTLYLLMLYGFVANAQLIVSNTVETPAQLVTNVLVDNSVTPYNIMFNGSAINANAVDKRAAHFTTNFNPTNLGLTAGILLTTGNAQVAMGPNDEGSATEDVTPWYSADPNLSALTTNVVRNSAVLEFDFVATGLEMSFDYVFGSEEYPVFVNSPFNDVFGFFLTGPNPDNVAAPYNNLNIAVVPNTIVPITINNVNNGNTNAGPCEYCQHYVNNGTGNNPTANPHVQYNGFTKDLKAVAKLKCGEIYHMKLAIGNVGDWSLDSGVFLKDFKITPLALVDGLNLEQNTSVCGTSTDLGLPPVAYFQNLDIPVPDYVTNPSDYNYYWSFNNTYDPANPGAYNPAAFVPVASVLLPTAIEDASYAATLGGVYSLVIETSYGCQVAEDEIQIWFEPYPLQAAPPLNICTPNPLPMNVDINQTAAIVGTSNAADFFITYYDSSLQDALDGAPTGVIPDATLSQYPMTTNTKDIWVRFEDTGSVCIYVVPFTVTISAAPGGTFSYPGTPYCAQLPTQPVTTNVTPGGVYSATPAGLSIDPTTGDIDPSASTPNIYTVSYLLAASGSCPAFTPPDATVEIVATPTAPTVTTPLDYCNGENAPALSAVGTNLLWYAGPSGGTGDPVAPTPNTASNGMQIYYVSQTNGCEGPRTPITVNVYPAPAVPNFTAPVYCQNEAASVLTATGTNLLWYTDATTGVGSASAPTPVTNTPGIFSFWVTQTVNNGTISCESPRAEIQVTVNPLPVAPTVPATPIGYCQGAVVSDLSSSATGTNLLWYTTPTFGVGNPVAPTPNTALTGSTNYYVSQTDPVTNCEGPRALITVTIFAIPAAPTPVVDPITCATASGTITVSSPVGVNLEYSIDNGVTFQSSNTFTTVALGTTYDVVVRNAISGCVSPAAQAIFGPALAVPAAPVAIVTAPANCYVPTATIDVQSPVGPDLEYSIDGGVTYQTGISFSGLAPSASYNITVRNTISGCTAGPVAVNVLPITANPAIPTFTVIQPICTTPTGTITVNAPTGSNFEYSINGGTTYQPLTAFSGLAPNATYTITVREVSTGCISSATQIVNPIPANPAIPTFTRVQPTCSVNTGSFTITAPVGANFQYSNDGGVTYQAGVTFTGLAAGATYNPIVKDMLTGCISAPASVGINPALNVPVAPTMSTTVQPICSAPTGIIVVTAPLGANLSYSIDGGTTYQANTTFAGLAPGTYSVIVKDNISSCTSTASQSVVNPLPANPAAPNASATFQPICTTPTGTIVVTAPLGIDLVYSINGGTTYQAGTTFAGLAPNTTYSLTVRNNITGCVSAPTQVVISPIPANPAIPTGTMTQPTCNAPTGAIDITGPLGANLEYSINGGAIYQAGTSFATLAPGVTYSIIVRNTLTGCVSAPGSFTIIPAPTFPATPVASGSDVCVDDSINLSTPAVAGATYSWTGPNGFISSVQNPVIPNATVAMSGTYSVVISTTSDCPSLPGSVTIVVNPLPEPTLAQNGNICFNVETNTVSDPYTLNAGLSDATYDFAWYVENGSNFDLIPTANQSSYVVMAPGVYGVIATNTLTGCVSDMVTAPVTMTSPPLSIAGIASEYFADLQTIAVNVLPVGNYEYQMDNGAWQTSNVFTDVISGTHTVRVRNECGILEDEAYVLDYPRFFTPNGDGYNDTWNIFALSSQPNSKIYIFDRYGKLLKQISPSGAGWDGTYNKQILPASDYWFQVHYEENNVSKVFKSHFAIKR